LRIDSVDSVDRGAGRGVRVVLTKRDEQERLDAAFALGRIHSGAIDKLARGKVPQPRPGKTGSSGNPGGDRNVVGDPDKLLAMIADKKTKGLVLDLMRRNNYTAAQAVKEARRLGITLPKAVTDVVASADLPGEHSGPLSKMLAKLGRSDIPAGTADPKRQPKETKMSGSKKLRCPECDHVGDEDDFASVDKRGTERHDLGIISKAARISADSMIDEALETLRKTNPSATRAQALSAAVGQSVGPGGVASISKSFNDLVVAERNARMRALGMA
jgi:hypothetical protein